MFLGVLPCQSKISSRSMGVVVPATEGFHHRSLTCLNILLNMTRDGVASVCVGIIHMHP